jgi:hypothetical protein
MLSFDSGQAGQAEGLCARTKIAAFRKTQHYPEWCLPQYITKRDSFHQ